MKWISTASLLLALGFGWTASQAMAQPGATGQSFDELSARLEQQDQQIQQLQAQMAGMQAGRQRDPGVFCPRGRHGGSPRCAGGPAMRRGRQRHELKVRWYNGAGLMFESPNKDFTMHAGLLGAMGQCVVEPVA